MTKQIKKGSVPQPTAARPGILAGVRDWHLLAFLALLVLVFFHEIVLRTSFFWEDFLYQFYPFRNFATVSLSRGEIPLWNPFTFSGMPFAADITGTVFYLPHLLLVPFVSGGKLGFWYVELFLLAHFVLAAATMFLCAKSFGLSRVPAAFSALAFALSGFTITHVIHLVIICQVAWFPLAVLLFRRMLDEHSLLWMILCGFVLSLIVCGGHIQITLYMFFFLFTFFVFELVHRITGRRRQGMDFPPRLFIAHCLLAGGAVAIAIGLSAIQLLPTAELAGLSVREEISFARSTEGQLFWQQLITLLIPRFFGTSNHLGGSNPNPFWGPQGSWNFWETCLYTGTAALALALLAIVQLKRHRYIAYFAGFALFSILFALGDQFILHRIFYDYVPGFNKFRDMGRWGFFFTFSVALLAGFGLQSLLTSKTREKFFVRILVVLVALPLVTLAALKLHLLDGFIHWQIRTGALRIDSPDAFLPVISGMVSMQCIIALAVTAGSMIILYLVWKNSLAPTLAIILLFTAQFLDMYFFGFSQNNGKVNPAQYFDERRSLIAKLKHEGTNEYFRVNARNGGAILIDRNQGMIDNIFMTEGYTQLSLQRKFPPARTAERMYDLLNAKYQLHIDTVKTPPQPKLQLRFDTDSTHLPRMFVVQQYRVFKSPEEETRFMVDSIFNALTTVLLEEGPDPAPRDTAGTARWTTSIQQYSNNTITANVTTTMPGFLVYSEIYYPGWNAYVDGRLTKLYRADWCFRAHVIDAGQHTVELRFEPTSFRNGATISVTVFVLCVATGAYSFWRRRRPGTAQEGQP